MLCVMLENKIISHANSIMCNILMLKNVRMASYTESRALHGRAADKWMKSGRERRQPPLRGGGGGGGRPLGGSAVSYNSTNHHRLSLATCPHFLQPQLPHFHRTLPSHTFYNYALVFVSLLVSFTKCVQI